MEFFTPVSGAVLLKSKGSYFSAPLFENEGRLFAKRASSYIRLLPHHSTSVTAISWSTIRFEKPELGYKVSGSDLVIQPTQLTEAA